MLKTQIPLTNMLVFSHLRWNFVFQRPQHLLTNFSKQYHIYYIEEPVSGDQDGYNETVEKGITVVTPVLSGDWTGRDERLASILDAFLLKKGLVRYHIWYYSPMFLTFTRHLKPDVVIFDCMDELSAFKFAPPELLSLEQELLELADVVFTGGHSLYKAKEGRNANVHCFPSSIDYRHFAQARMNLPDPPDQEPIPGPRIGFFGVVDERFDIDLLKEVAATMPEVSFVIIGPVVKIDPAILPQAENIHYLGKKEYAELPAYIANWDIAMMPFALNESTRFISPTKTPEYLAAGRPVISTAVHDVIHTYGQFGLVSIIDNASEFKQAIQRYLNEDSQEEWIAVNRFLAGMSWQKTCAEMGQLISQAAEKNGQFEQLV